MHRDGGETKCGVCFGAECSRFDQYLTASAFRSSAREDVGLLGRESLERSKLGSGTLDTKLIELGDLCLPALSDWRVLD